MKKCFFKTYKNLVLYKKNELNLLAFKLCFLKNKNLKNANCSNIKKKNYHKSFCSITGVKRSVYNFFNMARWNLKNLLISAKIVGLKRISW